MGVLPLEFAAGCSAIELGLNGDELYDLVGSGATLTPRGTVTVRARKDNGAVKEFSAVVRVDTPDGVSLPS